MRLEWDGHKAARNFKKHRVSFDEAVTVFYDPLAATFNARHADVAHQHVRPEAREYVERPRRQADRYNLGLALFACSMRPHGL